MPTSGSSNLGQRLPGVSSSCSVESTVTHCLPLVTPGRFSTLALAPPEIRFIKEDFPKMTIKGTEEEINGLVDYLKENGFEVQVEKQS